MLNRQSQIPGGPGKCPTAWKLGEKHPHAEEDDASTPLPAIVRQPLTEVATGIAAAAGCLARGVPRART